MRADRSGAIAGASVGRDTEAAAADARVGINPSDEQVPTAHTRQAAAQSIVVLIPLISRRARHGRVAVEQEDATCTALLLHLQAHCHHSVAAEIAVDHGTGVAPRGVREPSEHDAQAEAATTLLLLWPEAEEAAALLLVRLLTNTPGLLNEGCKCAATLQPIEQHCQAVVRLDATTVLRVNLLCCRFVAPTGTPTQLLHGP